MWLLLSVVVSGGNRVMAPCLVSGLGLPCAQLGMSSSDLQWPGQFLHFFTCVVSGAGPQSPSLSSSSYLIHLCFVSSASSVICQLFIRNFTLFSCVQVSTFFCRLSPACPTCHVSDVSRAACLVRVCGGVGAGVSCCPRGGAVVDLAAEVVLVCLQRLNLLPQLRDLGVQQLLVIR